MTTILESFQQLKALVADYVTLLRKIEDESRLYGKGNASAECYARSLEEIAAKMDADLRLPDPSALAAQARTWGYHLGSIDRIVEITYSWSEFATAQNRLIRALRRACDRVLEVAR